MFIKTTACAAAIALSTTSTFAGGLSPEIVEAVPVEKAATPAFSINPTYIVLGVVALILIASAGGDDDPDDEPDGETTDIKDPCILDPECD